MSEATLALALVLAIAILAALALDLRVAGLLPARRHAGSLGPMLRSAGGPGSGDDLDEILEQAQALENDLQSLIARRNSLAGGWRRMLAPGDADLVRATPSDGNGLRSRAERDLARALPRRS